MTKGKMVYISKKQAGRLIELCRDEQNHLKSAVDYIDKSALLEEYHNLNKLIEKFNF